jgi:hypothetical protein
MNSLFLFIQKFVSFIINKIFDFFSNINYNAYILFILFTFSKMWINMGNRMKHQIPGLYRKYQNCLILWNRHIQVIYSFIYNHRVEPYEQNWVNHSTIDPSIIPFKYLEKYEFHSTKSTSDKCIDAPTVFNTAILLTNTKSFINNCNITQLLTMKNENQYIYRVLSPQKTVIPVYCNDLSKMNFLSILYTHSKMENAVYIEIPKNALLQGNEILSQHFILRYLEHQSMPFLFDLTYSIQIMDNNINQFTLNSNQYVLLTETDYIVKTIE